jgi:hypothetical protein
MAIQQSNLAQLTARAGVLRAGTGRAGAAPKVYELKANGTGQIIWDRAQAGTVGEGNPDDTADTWATGRE